MARYISVLAFLLFATVNGEACDACGCSISGQGIGLLTNFRTNVAGIRYFNTPFHAAPLEGSTEDRFHLAEFFVRYQFNKRFKLMLSQPYRYNVRRDLHASSLDIDGIADTRILGSYALVDQWTSNTSRLYWELGAGIKLPVGKYDADIHDRDMPENFNIGNGSWGYLLQTSAVYSNNQFGISLNAASQLNGKTSAGYHFGNQISGSLLLFTEKSLGKKGRIVPLVGGSAEIISKDKFANGKNVHSTGGRGLYGMIGVNAGFDRWQLGASFSKPLTQHYSDGEVIADDRFSIEMNYFF
ncbi:MAG: transporter [Bacteroidota bacterium]